MSITYPFLFYLCFNQNITLADVVSSQGLAVSFTRTLTGVNRYEWAEVLKIVHTFQPDHEDDTLHWKWDSKGVYTVESLYQFLNFGGIKELYALTWWTVKTPPKIQVFMWLVTKKKTLTKSNLAKKGWVWDITCHFCRQKETPDHLFVQCPRTRQV